MTCSTLEERAIPVNSPSPCGFRLLLERRTLNPAATHTKGQRTLAKGSALALDRREV